MVEAVIVAEIDALVAQFLHVSAVKLLAHTGHVHWRGQETWVEAAGLFRDGGRQCETKLVAYRRGVARAYRSRIGSVGAYEGEATHDRGGAAVACFEQSGGAIIAAVGEMVGLVVAAGVRFGLETTDGLLADLTAIIDADQRVYSRDHPVRHACGATRLDYLVTELGIGDLSGG